MKHLTLEHSRVASPLCLCALAIGLSACGSSATHELADARSAYDDAEDGPARTHRPGELHSAKNALDRAEQAHDDNPGSNREKRLSEVAEHKAEVADARGEAAQAELTGQAARARANRESRELRERNARANLAKVDRDKDEVVVKDQPRPARVAASDEPRVNPYSNERANDALQHLTSVSRVREDERGIVITLSGSLLFPSGQDELSPVAQQHLDEVADALREQPKAAKFRIEGYTDSSGAAKLNEQLSTKRAHAVADYLVAHGIDASRTDVAGYGEQRPIADNNTEDGRASNRRVEVIIAKQPETR